MIIKGSRCPECNSEIEYSGNYFCPNCGWALPDNKSHRTKKEKETFKVAYVLYMKQTNQEDNIDFHLIK